MLFQYLLGYVVLTTLDPQTAYLNISGQYVCTSGVFRAHGLSRPGASCCPCWVASRASALEACLFLSSTLHGLKFYQEGTQDTLSQDCHCLKSSVRRSLMFFLQFVREHNLKAAGGMKVRHLGGQRREGVQGRGRRVRLTLWGRLRTECSPRAGQPT